MNKICLKDIEHFKNSYGFYSSKVKELGLPTRTYWSSDNAHWINTDNIDETLYLVSKTTANKIKEPISEDEQICGFTKVKKGYTPLYSRPDAIFKISSEFIYIVSKDDIDEGFTKDEIISMLLLIYFEKDSYKKRLEDKDEDRKLAFEMDDLLECNDSIESMEKHLKHLQNIENKLIKMVDKYY